MLAYDLDSSNAENVLQLRASCRESPAEIGKEVYVLITCLPSAHAVNNVLAGEYGAFETLSNGVIWVELNINSTAEISCLSKIGKEIGIDTVKATLTGGAYRGPTGKVTDAKLAEKMRQFGARRSHEWFSDSTSVKISSKTQPIKTPLKL